MPRDIIEIAPETDFRSKLPPTSKVFSEQYAALLAEHAIQNNDQQLQRRHRYGLPSWLALAVATGAVVAFAFVYYLSR